MKETLKGPLLRHVLFGGLRLFTSRLSSSIAKEDATEAPGCLDSCASADDQQGIASHAWPPATGIRFRPECMCRKKDLASSRADTPRAVGQTCIRPEIEAASSVQKSLGEISRSTKYNPRVPWLARLLILGVCAYGPALPMWYLSTTSLQPPIWLLLATQGWLAMSLGLLAWSWVSGEVSSPNSGNSRMLGCDNPHFRLW